MSDNGEQVIFILDPDRQEEESSTDQTEGSEVDDQSLGQPGNEQTDDVVGEMVDQNGPSAASSAQGVNKPPSANAPVKGSIR